MYSDPSQSSKKQLFGITVNGFQQLTIFSKNSILDWQGSEYVSVEDQHLSKQQTIAASRKKVTKQCESKKLKSAI